MWKCENVKVSRSNIQLVITGWLSGMCMFAHCVEAATFSAVSPDGKNEIRLETNGGGMEYSIWRGNKAIIEPTRFSLTVE